MLRKIYVFIFICVLIIAITAICILYNYKMNQKRLIEEAIITVTDITRDNLKVEYNNNFTNTNVEVQLSTDSGENIIYSFNNADYIEYNRAITVEDNCTIYVKYMNSYGTYSSNEYLIDINNIDKIQPKITKKEIVASTNSLTINIDAEDNIEIAKVEVSINTEDYIEVVDKSYTFNGLDEGTEYLINIKVTDIAGNIMQDEIKETTQKQETSSNLSKNFNTNKSTSSNKSNTTSSNSSTNNNSNSNTSNNKVDSSQTWNTNTYYGGEIYDSSGVNGGYWMYGEDMDFNGIDMSDWTFNN
jgi:hypothetical protein